MKLLSRFIWLIVGISAIVFIGIAIFQMRASNEFELIKESISDEYDVQVDKMLAPEPYGKGMASYVKDICEDSDSHRFLTLESHGNLDVPITLQTDFLKFYNVDAVWILKANGDIFYFNSDSEISETNVDLPLKEVPTKVTGDLSVFYGNIDQKTICFNGAAITNTSGQKIGYVVIAGLIDKEWIADKYESSINNSVVTVVPADAALPEIDRRTIRITRDFNALDGQKVATLNVELHLPFLSLWDKTNATDRWLMIGSIVIIVFFLIVFMSIWVISPLRKISFSLQKGDSEDIQPLIKGSSEMGEVARMIKDYHQKNDELEASESIKRHIIEQAQVGIIIAEEESGVIITANPYACQLIEALEDAVAGNIIANFLAPQENKEDQKEGFESTLINSKGENMPVLRTSTKMVMDGKNVVMDTFVDLSEIKTLQDKLAEEKKKLSLAVQNSGLVFCEYDFKADELSLDPEWQFLTKGESKHVGTNLINNIYESDRKKVTDNFSALESGVKDTLAAEFRVHHPNRGIIWLSVTILITKRDEEHKPRLLIGLMQDITERIAVQQELIKAKEKAEESDRMKSSYLGNMSHKIRTPLNTIVGFANLLTEEELEAEQKENFINIIRNDTEQVLHLIDDMINLAKIDAEQYKLDIKATNINKMLNGLADYYKAHDKTETIKFNVKTMLEDGKDIVQADEEKVHQALDNLLNNAFKFTTEGSIELGYFIHPVDNKLILYVKDSGMGIPDEHKDKIVNRFYQINAMTEGTGLGLTITDSLVKLMKGKLYFDSKVNEGSTFYLELPIQTT